MKLKWKTLLAGIAFLPIAIIYSLYFPRDSREITRIKEQNPTTCIGYITISPDISKDNFIKEKGISSDLINCIKYPLETNNVKLNNLENTVNKEGRGYSSNYNYSDCSRNGLMSIANEEAEKYNVDLNLVYAVIDAESTFRCGLKSGRGALGPMQVLVSTARDYDPYITENELKYNPRKNINVGTRHLKYLLNKHGNNEYLALAEYNGGNAALKYSTSFWCAGKRVFECKINYDYHETREYVDKTLRYYKEYRRLSGTRLAKI